MQYDWLIRLENSLVYLKTWVGIVTSTTYSFANDIFKQLHEINYKEYSKFVDRLWLYNLVWNSFRFISAYCPNKVISYNLFSNFTYSLITCNWYGTMFGYPAIESLLNPKNANLRVL
jgi:hypothetical protein